MNVFGFSGLPAHAAAIDDDRTPIERRWVAGLARLWQMPCAAFNATDGFDVLIQDQQEHHTISVPLALNGFVERVDGPLAGTHVPQEHFTLQHRGETHRYRSTVGIRFAHVYFRPELLAHIADTAARKPGVRYTLRDDLVDCDDRVLMADLRTYVDRAASTALPATALEMDSRSIVIGLSLLERHGNRPFQRESLRGGLAPWQLKRVCEAMETRLDSEVTLSCLADLVGISPTHLSRAFKQSTGRPPFEWLLHRRIERAKSLLQDTGQPLADVALAVGFSAQPQFTTAFRRVTGVTPGAWRRERST